jgi:hypothetical protein
MTKKSKYSHKSQLHFMCGSNFYESDVIYNFTTEALGVRNQQRMTNRAFDFLKILALCKVSVRERVMMVQVQYILLSIATTLQWSAQSAKHDQ